MKKIYILGAVVCGLVACKPNIEPKAPERGDADFSSYVAVGSAHTAGVTDGSYFREGQDNSYPLMLSRQFESVGGGEFKQPYVMGQHGWPTAKYVLDYIQGPCDTLKTVGVELFSGALDTVGTARNIFAQGPFHNMGIPGTKVTDYLTPGLANNNIYAARIFKNPATARAVTEIQSAGHTFFSVWLGIDDVLDYAKAGGKKIGVQPVRETITEPNRFSVAYDSVLFAMTRNGAKGVLLTIPDLLDMPYFRAISPRSLFLDIKDANKYNVQYNSTQVHFDVGMNYYVIEDKTVSEGFRQMKDGEIVLMDIPMDSIKCSGWGSAKPIPARYVLTFDEIEKIWAATAAYNGIIIKLAENYNLPVSETRYFFRNILADGAHYNGADYSFRFYEGGIFSLDGLTLTGRGNALLANSIIYTINEYYKSSIHDVDANKYSGVKIP